MSWSMNSCWTCRIRKKGFSNCGGPTPSGDCSKCLKLNVECLRGYGRRVPAAYRDRKLNSAIAEWTRCSIGRVMQEPLNLRNLVRPSTLDSLKSTSHPNITEWNPRHTCPARNAEPQQSSVPAMASSYLTTDISGPGAGLVRPFVPAQISESIFPDAIMTESVQLLPEVATQSIGDIEYQHYSQDGTCRVDDFEEVFRYLNEAPIALPYDADWQTASVHNQDTPVGYHDAAMVIWPTLSQVGTLPMAEDLFSSNADLLYM